LNNEQLCRLVGSVAADRDRDAFARLFRYFAPRLKGFGLRCGLAPAAAEELVQETLLTVWRRAESFDARRTAVATWIFTIVRNRRIAMMRREGYPEAGLSEAYETPTPDLLAFDAASAIEFSKALQAAMETLPKEQLDILEKAFYEAKSHRAIADELRMPLGTVKSRIRLALARLRGALPEVQV
jgi:RNA polymerase sigma-70 factor (ECF subfamily)